MKTFKKQLRSSHNNPCLLNQGSKQLTGKAFAFYRVIFYPLFTTAQRRRRNANDYF